MYGRARFDMFWLTALGLGLIVVSIAIVAYSAPEDQTSNMPTSSEAVDSETYHDANSLLMFVDNIGAFAYDRSGILSSNGGLLFPKDTNEALVCSAGLWMGALVNGQVRVAVSGGNSEFVPGPMRDGTFQNDRPEFRVYKISAGDTRASNPDYAEWPFDQGAPAVKSHTGQDSLDGSGNRIPLLKGNQALWTVFNDASPGPFESTGRRTLPLGVEVQLYVYGDDVSCPAGRTLIMEYTIINKGGNQLHDGYLSYWAALGPASYWAYNFVGCDTLQNLGYAYYRGPDEENGVVLPAFGLKLLRGPSVHHPVTIANGTQVSGIGSDNEFLSMTSFNSFRSSWGAISAPISYNYMRGLQRDGQPVTDPATGLPTVFKFSGDPESGGGWVDDLLLPKNLLVSTGPFDMDPGDTQSAVIAVMVGQGRDLSAQIPDSSAVYDTIYAVHTAGSSGGRAFALVADSAAVTGRTYNITIQEGTPQSFYSWSLEYAGIHDTIVSGVYNQTGQGPYPEIDGLIVKLISPTPGVGDVQIVGEQQFTWQYANDLDFEGFNGAIGWGGPSSVFGYGEHYPVLPSDLVAVELRFADTDADGNVDPDDPNASYGYRYLRNQGPPARPEFAPYILNPDGGPYRFQEFAKNVPLSAWDVTSDPPRRLTVGFLENNVFQGMVDGKYWPPLPYVIGNTSGNGPREWLWIYLDDYQETPKPEYMGSAIDDSMPIMYWCTMARSVDGPLKAGSSMRIIPADHNTKADVFEFTAPPPPTRSEGDLRVEPGFTPILSCWREDPLSSLAALRRVDSVLSMSYTLPTALCACQYRCDFNSDDQLDASDLNTMLKILFYRGEEARDSQCPTARSDFNADGLSDVSDLNDLIAHIFFGGPAPGNPCQ